MINNIGQPFTTRAYGNLERGLNGTNLAYFLGDASQAYCGVSEYSMWQDAFSKAGISQTPEYGFGETPLNNYKRHIFMLRPNKVVIYDDLGADEPATWQWLLHSPVEFHVAGNKVTTNYTTTDKGNFTAVAQIYCEQIPTITTTKDWFPGGEPTSPADVAKQWHLTADFEASMNNKILTIIQLSDNGQVEDVWQVNNRFTLGDWIVEAEMAADKPATIKISNKTTGTVFDYGSVELQLDGFLISVSKKTHLYCMMMYLECCKYKSASLNLYRLQEVLDKYSQENNSVLSVGYKKRRYEKSILYNYLDVCRTVGFVCQQRIGEHRE